MDEFHSISGGWLGTYAYEGRQAKWPPVRFEASFTEVAGGQITASILDDCQLGEASATGSRQGLSVRFTKTYNSPPRPTSSVEYAGRISEDGMTMTGTWRITQLGLRVSGVWDARRIWSAENATVERSEGETLVAVAGAGREYAER